MKHTRVLMSSLALLGLSLPGQASDKSKADQGNPEVAKGPIELPKIVGAEVGTRPLVKVEGHAYIVGPDGKVEKVEFGENTPLKLDKGGAKVELKVAPKNKAIEQFKKELEATFEEKGLDKKLLEQALKALENPEKLGHFQLRGLMLGPDGQPHEFHLGDEKEKPEKMDQRMKKEGGAGAELKVEPGEGLTDLLGKALSNPETLKSLGEAAGNPNLGNLLGDALKDPAIQGLLQQGLNNPEARKRMQEGLGDPNLLKMAEGFLKDENMQKLAEGFLKDENMQKMMKQFMQGGGPEGFGRGFPGGAPDLKKLLEEPDKADPATKEKTKRSKNKNKAGDSTPKAKNDETREERKERRRQRTKEKRERSLSADQQEIEALRKELTEQRALLEKLLKELENENE